MSCLGQASRCVLGSITVARLTTHFWRITTILATIALVALATTVVVTGQEGPSGPQQQATGPAAPVSGGAGSINHVNVVTETVAQTTSSTAFVALPGASTTISVPAGEAALLVARFTAESQCTGAAAGSWCSVRILVNGAEADPASGIDFAFDAVPTVNTTDFWEGHAMDRSKLVGAGNYVVIVQWAVTNASTTFRLDDWSFTVERAQKA
jgi:hypothetical protein